MNTAAHIAGLLSLLYLSVYCFVTLDDFVLGLIFFILMLGSIPMLILAVHNDYEQLRTKRWDEEE